VNKLIVLKHQLQQLQQLQQQQQQQQQETSALACAAAPVSGWTGGALTQYS
jgi:hypothetical protein